MKWAALALLCFYAAAMAHQVLPHHPGHGRGEACSLCQLLTSVAVAGASVVAVFIAARLAPMPVSPSFPYCRPLRQPFSLRGPPRI